MLALITGLHYVQCSGTGLVLNRGTSYPEMAYCAAYCNMSAEVVARRVNVKTNLLRLFYILRYYFFLFCGVTRVVPVIF